MKATKHAYRRALLLSTAVAAVSGFLIGHDVRAEEAKKDQLAADSQQAQANRLEEITVTARRVEENIQRVPVDVVAISQEQLLDQHFSDIMQLQRVLPGITQKGGKASNTNIAWVRGLTGVATYFADAPSTIGFRGQMLDVGSVQLLKGPQGTLFGQNSAAGAFVVNPNKPTNNFEGFVALGLGTYDRVNPSFAVNVPVVDDKLMFRFAGEHNQRKGYIYDVVNNKDYNNDDEWTGRVSMTMRPLENVENYTMFQVFTRRSNGYSSGQLLTYDPASTSVPKTVGLARMDFLLAQAKANPYKFYGITLAQGFSGLKQREISVVNNTRWDIMDNMALTNILGWRSTGYRSYVDGQSWAYNPLGVVNNDPRAVATRSTPLVMNHPWSDELKLTGSLFSWLSYTVGVFHNINPAIGDKNWGLSGGVETLNVSKGYGLYGSPQRSDAVYGQAEADLSQFYDGLKFAVGYRNTWDMVSVSRVDWNPAAVPVSTPTDQIPVSRVLYSRAKYSYSNYLFSLREQFTPDTMAYLSFAKGVTGGGVSPTFPKPYDVTKPETLKQIELGVKSTFYVGDIQFRADVAGYYGWYTNVQTPVAMLLQVSPPPAPKSFTSPIINIGTGRLRGVDMDFTIAPTSWAEFSWAGALNRNKYTYWPVFSPDGTTIIGSNAAATYIGNPRLKWNASGTLFAPLEERYGKLSFSVYYSYTGLINYFPNIKGVTHIYDTHDAAHGYGPLASDGSVHCVACSEAHGQLDLLLKWVDPMGVNGVTATMGLSNVTQTKYGDDGSAYSYSSVGYLALVPNPPRMMTFDVRYSF